MNVDKRLRNILQLILTNLDLNLFQHSLHNVFNYITLSNKFNIIECLFSDSHLLANGILLIIISLFCIILHFIHVL